jgi:hypothetical protein
LRSFTKIELEKSKDALEADEYGASNWVAHNERIVAGCDAALAVDEDDTELGKFIRVYSGNIIDDKNLSKQFK